MTAPFSATLLAELRSDLERRAAEMRREIAALRTAEGADALEDVLLPDDVPDRADLGADQAEWDRQRITELALRDQLAEIDHALAKFDAGTYGLCEQCGRPIPVARLRALPEARYDVAHQAEAESRAGR